MEKPRVLVVEDEALVGLEIKESLERMGYSVPCILDSGDTVLDSVMRYDPDVVVMDIHLRSFTDGIDAAARLRLLKEVPIIYVTAFADSEIKERAARTGPAAYLMKPLDDQELKTQIDLAIKPR